MLPIRSIFSVRKRSWLAAERARKRKSDLATANMSALALLSLAFATPKAVTERAVARDHQ